ncbi:protein FATTY ACID EXPORT [Salix suchowensis]|nr:protein FATTY ACID EXPORT [Salix suchowensis]
MSCSFLLIPTKFPALNGSNKDIISTTMLGFSSFSCLRNERRSIPMLLILHLTSAVYGVILLGGGLFAFSKSGSKRSLFGGLTGAALMGTAYFLIQAPETKAIGDSLGFGSSFLFSSVFEFDCFYCLFILLFSSTSQEFDWQLIPSGLLLVLSICALSVFISTYLQDNL